MITTMHRTQSHELVDVVINHPSVRPTMQDGTYRLESFEVVHNANNVILYDGCGVALFVWQRPGVYEGHVAVIDAHRGSRGLEFGRAALVELFGRYEALSCMVEVPLELRAARWFVRKLGFTSLGPNSTHERFVMEGPYGRDR